MRSPPQAVRKSSRVSPMRWSYEDVGAPGAGNIGSCECGTDGPDGFEDLVLKFDKEDIVGVIGPVADGKRFR